MIQYSKSRQALRLGIGLTLIAQTVAFSGWALEELTLSPTLSARSAQDRTFESAAGGLGLEARFRARDRDVAEIGGFRTEAFVAALFENGSAVSRTQDRYAPRNRFELREASTHYGDGGRLFFLEGAAGVLNQAHWDTPLLFGDKGLPALRETLRWKLHGPWAIQAEAQQAMVTGTDTAPFANLDQTLPKFFQESLALEFPGIGNAVSAPSGQIFFRHFSFQDLGTAQAQESRFLGNSVGGLGAANAFFGYEFYGFNGGIRMPIGVGPSVAIFVKGDFMNNWGAPLGTNQAWRAELAPEWRTHGRFEARLQPYVALFRAEADSAPAALAALTMGPKNTKGVQAGFRARTSEGWFGRFDWTRSTVIEERDFQEQFTSYEMSVGRVYEIL